VSDEEATETARRLAREEGILCGISCGAAMAAALRLAHEEQFKGHTFVVILPDSAERYLSTSLFEE
jgi:cysteine synthase